MTDHSGLLSGGAIPPEALGTLPAPIVAVNIGRSTWQGPEDQAPRPAPRYTIAPLHWSIIAPCMYRACALGFTYLIEPAAPWSSRWRVTHDHTSESLEFAEIDAAKAAAQQDFDLQLRQWIRDALPAASVADRPQPSADLLLAQLDSHLRRHGFAEAGVMRTLVRWIGADLRGVKGGDA